MKNRLLFLLISSFSAFCMYSQEALYISAQTGEKSKITGSSTQTTEEGESGTGSCSSSGPIDYEIDPYSQSESSTVTFSGWVTPSTAPDAGTSEDAKITCSGTWHWLTWDYDTDSKTKDTSNSATKERLYTVYSVQIVLPDEINCDCGNFNLSYTSVYPEGGTVEWETPWGQESGNNVSKAYDPSYKGKTVTAKYTIGGVSYSATSTLTCKAPSFSVNVTECVGNKATVKVDGDEECGDFSWAGYGTGSCSGLECEVDVSPNLSEENQKITVTYMGQCGDTLVESTDITMGELVGFQLPPCDDTIVSVANIAILDFEGDCEPNVIFSPSTLTPPSVLAYETVEVTATSGDVSLTSQIVMVNSGQELDVNIITFDSDILGVFETYLDAILGLGTPCSKSGSLLPKGSISIGTRVLCCPDSGQTTGTSIKGNLSWGAGWGCRGPIFGVPYVASIDALFNVGVNGTLGVDGIEECTSVKICANGGLSGSIGGGLGFTLAAGLVSGELQLIVDGVGLKVNYCFTPVRKGDYSIAFGAGKVEGTVSEIWGLISHSVSYPLWSGAAYGPYPL